MAARLCPACHAELTRHPGERRADFVRRAYCGWDCSVADRTRKAEEARTAQDARDREDADEFERAGLLRAAALAAPMVAGTRLAAILDAVEPLIAANVRRRTLAPIAAEIRARRPA